MEAKLQTLWLDNGRELLRSTVGHDGAFKFQVLVTFCNSAQLQALADAIKAALAARNPQQAAAILGSTSSEVAALRQAIAEVDGEPT